MTFRCETGRSETIPACGRRRSVAPCAGIDPVCWSRFAFDRDLQRSSSLAGAAYGISEAIDSYHDRIALKGLGGKPSPIRLIVAGEPMIIPANMIRFRAERLGEDARAGRPAPPLAVAGGVQRCPRRGLQGRFASRAADLRDRLGARLLARRRRAARCRLCALLRRPADRGAGRACRPGARRRLALSRRDRLLHRARRVALRRPLPRPSRRRRCRRPASATCRSAAACPCSTASTGPISATGRPSTAACRRSPRASSRKG